MNFRGNQTRTTEKLTFCKWRLTSVGQIVKFVRIGSANPRLSLENQYFQFQPFWCSFVCARVGLKANGVYIYGLCVHIRFPSLDIFFYFIYILFLLYSLFRIISKYSKVIKLFRFGYLNYVKNICSFFFCLFQWLPKLHLDVFSKK